MTDFHIIIGAVAIAAAYIVLCNRFTALVHPIRMRMADLGRSLLESGIHTFLFVKSNCKKS